LFDDKGGQMKKCGHPNCKLAATQQHPKSDKWLCENHYAEVLSSLKTFGSKIELTVPGDIVLETR